MHLPMSWFGCVLLISFLCTIIAKPIKPEPSQSSPEVRGMDTLAGVSIGSNKATRSTRGYSQRSLDSLGNANYLRSLDSLGGQNFLRSLENWDEVLRNFDPETVARLNKALEYMANDRRRYNNYRPGSSSHSSLQAAGPSVYDSLQQLDYRTLDSLGGANLLRSIDPSAGAGMKEVDGGVDNHSGGKRLDSLSGLTLGLQKRTFDEVDRTAFDGFNKRNFDEVDRVGFDGFSKRNVRSVAKSSSSS